MAASAQKTSSTRRGSKPTKKGFLAKVIPLRPRSMSNTVKAASITVFGVTLRKKAPKLASKAQQKAQSAVYAALLENNAAPTPQELAAVRAQRAR